MACRIALLLATLSLVIGCATQPRPYPWKTLTGEPPIVIAHRGDSGNYPEHTLMAYRHDHGADYVEIDVVLTRDAYPVCRHDLYLSTTTNVASRPEFADRKRVIDGRADWYVFDFTLAELRTLSTVQPVRGRDQSHNGKYGVPLLLEALKLRRQISRATDRDAGLYIEIKKPAAHFAQSLDPTQAVLNDIPHQGRVAHDPPIILQCFDRGEIERLAEATVLPAVWLTADPIDFNDLPEGIAGLGVSKDLIQLKDGRSDLVEQAHKRGLFVHVWTFRDDRLDGTGYASGEEEIEAYLRAGVDGVFTDFPATGIAARQAIMERSHSSKSEKRDEPLSQRIRRQSPRRFLRRY